MSSLITVISKKLQSSLKVHYSDKCVLIFLYYKINPDTENELLRKWKISGNNKRVSMDICLCHITTYASLNHTWYVI